MESIKYSNFYPVTKILGVFHDWDIDGVSNRRGAGEKNISVIVL